MKDFKAQIRTKKIACIGAGYVGGPTMVTLARKCPHLEVRVLDISVPRIDAWNSEDMPIYEPGLYEAVKECRGRNLFFSSDVIQGIKDCDIIFVSVNTPTKRTGLGKGRASDLSSWELAGRSIAQHSENSKIVVEKSTVPVRTADALQRVLEANENPNVKFEIVSNPEFLAEGTAMKDLSAPDRVLIGGNEDSEDGQYAIQCLVDLYQNWVARDKIITTNLWSSELSKLVANAFLAQRISSINSISMLCESTGADVQQVASSIGTDTRIGSKFLEASVGFGGSCFQKDILSLVYLCEQFNLHEVAAYWEQVVTMNDAQKKRFTERIINCLFKTVDRKKIAIFGFAFKKNTGDTRETAALDVCAGLMEDGAILNVYDPKVSRTQALQEFKDKDLQDAYNFEKQFVMLDDPAKTVEHAHAIVVLTEWDEFKTLPYADYFKKMKKPSFIFDGRGILDHKKLWQIGFETHTIGRKPLLQNKTSTSLWI